MIISDGTLQEMILTGHLSVSPLIFAEHLQPASIDVELGSSFQRFEPCSWIEVDPRRDNSQLGEARTVRPGGFFALRPGEFALGTTLQHVRLPGDLVGRVEGKSSLARLGLVVHTTAGFIDPGFEGTITLEFVNHSGYTIHLWPGMKIAQLSFEYLDKPALRPYGHPELNSKYQGQTDATPSAYHRN